MPRLFGRAIAISDDKIIVSQDACDSPDTEVSDHYMIDLGRKRHQTVFQKHSRLRFRFQ